MTLHLASWHTAPGYDNANFGGGIECEIAEGVALNAGAFRNSFGDATTYATLSASIGAPLSVGVFAGVAPSGYRRNFWPMAGALVGYALSDRARVSVAISPTVDTSGAVAHAMLTIDL
ncbi:MAG: hypothetical protein ACREUQ_07450 [Burkholderiales bacterium]